MTQIAGKPFSQLQNLNLLDEFRVQGVLQSTVNDVYVNSVDEMPHPVLKDGVLTIIPEGKQYTFTETINSQYPLSHPGDGLRATFKAINGAQWNYTGTDSCFRDLDARGDIECEGQVEFTANNGNMWSCATNGGSASFQATGSSRFRDCLGLGSIAGPDYQFNHFFGSITGFGTGLDAENTSFFEINTVFIGSEGTETTTFIRVHGNQTTGAVNFILISTATAASETLLDIDHDIADSVNSVLIDTLQRDGDFLGSPFAPNSLDQTDTIVIAQGSASVGIPNSTVKGKLQVTDNLLVTNLVTIDTPVPINAIWSDGTVEERLCFQDYCLFDSSTNTVTAQNNISAAPFNHGLSDGDPIFLVERDGLPAELIDKQEYFVVNSTLTTFQLSLTQGGPVVTFADNGTPDNYYCHETGVSVTGWVIYTGLQDVSLIVSGWAAIAKAGPTQNAGLRLIKTSADFIETNGARGSNVTVSNTTVQSSQMTDLVNLSRYEGVKIYLEGRTAVPDDMTITDAYMTFNIA